MPRRRLAITVVLLLLAGAAVNVGVAWAVAIWPNRSTQQTVGTFLNENGENSAIALYSRFGHTAVNLIPNPYDEFPLGPTLEAPVWSRSRGVECQLTCAVVTLASGLPIRSMRFRVDAF